MRKQLAFVFGLLFAANTAYAASTINPTIPAQNAPMASSPIRGNFQAAYNDINNVLTKFGSNTAPMNPSTNQDWVNTTATPWVWNVYDGLQWLEVGTINASTHVFTPVAGGPPGGAAGGDLGGTYPNPTVFSISHIVTQQKINLNTAPLQAAQTGTILQLGNANSTITRQELDSYAAASHLSTVRADGTAITPTTLQAADELGGFNAWGYNGSAFVGPKAAFRTYADQNWTTGANGTYADIAVTSDGSTTLTQVVKFANDGSVTLGSPTGGGEGAGTLNASLYNQGVAVTNASSLFSSGAVPATRGGTGLSVGTSGGLLYFPTTTTIASSGALSGLVFGNGAGSAPTVFAGTSCTNQFVRSLNASGVATCNTVANTDLANSSITIGGASTALGGTVTTTTMLDSVGSVQGDLLYRSASGWTVLAPGSSGNVLQSNGASANPSWVATTPQVATAPTQQKLTSGTGATYTTPAGVKYIVIQEVGAGAGGAGGDASATSNGGVTSFDNAGANVIANGGHGAQAPGTGASGGSGTGTGTGTNIFRVAGAGNTVGMNIGAQNGPGMQGANSYFGGAGAASGWWGGAACTAAAANSGSGGGGGAGSSNSGGGGGAGEYVQYQINAPAASYTYTVGSGSAGSSSTTSGCSGGSGVIIVTEHYNY